MMSPLRRLMLKCYRTLQGFRADAGAVFASRLLQNANGFFLSIIIVRKFGLEEVGALTISSTATVFLATLCTFGLPFVFAHSQEPIPTRNSVGMVASCAAILLSLPVCAAFGFAFGRNSADAWAILFLAMAGPFFAQTTIANSLLVLQSGAGDILFSPLGNLVGLIVGYVFTDDFLTFCIVLAAFRFAGSFATFRHLRLGRVSFATCAAHLRKGVRFLSADTVSLLAEQASVIAASTILSRESLGLYGLCRQIITVSDTPASSSAVVWYPRACERPVETLPALQRHMLAMGLICAVALALLSVPLGYWIYELPDFAWLAPLVLTSVPFRYLTYAYELTARALNSVPAIRSLALLRCLVAAIPPLLMLVAGLPGGIGGIVAQMVVTATVAWMIARRALKGRNVLSERADLVPVS